jgi:hypothetical protein
MKIIRVVGISLTLLACSVGTSNAWLSAGRVLCDANQNNQIDANDQAVVGVFVVVTNVSGTFSNGNFTTTPGGNFAVELPPAPDSYVVFVHPQSLPAGSTLVLPAGGSISFSLTATVSNFFGGDFLIANPACIQTNQPATNSLAGLVAGRVLCDANQSGQIDASDQPVLGAFVVVTNVSGTFSNGDFTATPGGDFVLNLPAVPDSYVLFVHPQSLPAGSTSVLPASGSISFNLTATVSNFLGANFLIANPACVETNQPPPPTQTNNTCCLSGKATIGGTSKKPLFTLSATVFPGCRCDKEDSGEFEVVANGLRLQFKGTVAEILDCGESVDSSSGALINSIEVHGVGTLKGINGNRCNSGLVYFFAHVEDRSAAKLADALYFRAYATDNATLLLISGDTANPANVSPVSVCGNLVVGTDCCQENNQGGNGHGNGKGPGEGNGNGKGQGKGNQGDQDQGNKGKGGNGNDQGKGKGWGNNKGGSGKGKGGW